MDILPLPHNPTSPTTKVPYVCSERYDGLAFLTYPSRIGRPEMVSPTFPPGVEFNMHEKAHPTPVTELESLYQTWLYFGLLCEFFNVNEDSPGVPPRTEGSKEQELDAIYQFFTITNEDEEKLVTSRVILIPELELWKWKGDEETRKVRCRHLFECLRITHWMLQWLPPDFDNRIKISIAALAEFFNFNLGILAATSGWKDVQTFSAPWAAGVLTKSMKEKMRENGWCPSAIEETKVRNNGLQTINLICKMERGGPRRDHERCTERTCVNYQIDRESYQLSHAEEGCSCSMLEVDSNAITNILRESESSLPLLKVVLGDSLEDLRIEIKPSSSNIPYIAISHVWADGLGNPFSNSLHRCQLVRLQRLIEQLDTSTLPSSSEPKPASLLWVDTLCCPAINGLGKQKAIEKLRRVYENASAVLVLDASLLSIPTAPLHISEIVIRAYTSPWMRRLWTLQEGALNQNLYLQFADRAISAQRMIDDLKSLAWNQDSRYIHPFMDMHREHLSIRSFFHESPHTTTTPCKQLETLETALQSRSFSVESDEPLCIATLMSLDITAILALEGAQERMREMWSLLSQKFGGIPASIIFHEDYCLSFESWKWAPRSFVPHPNSQFDLTSRKRRWTIGPQTLGTTTPLGLRCQFPGFRLCSTTTEAKDAWKGIFRPSETSVMLRDEEGVWYSLTKSKTPSTKEPDFLQKMRELRISKGWPLRDTIEGGESAIVLELEMKFKNGAEREATWGILVRVKKEAETEPGVFAAERKEHILITTLYKEEAMVQETYRRIWMQVREDTAIAKLKEIEDEESADFKNTLREVTDKMKKVMKDELETNSDFKAALPRLYGKSYDPDSLWIRMANWWEQENVAVMLPSDQIWCID